MFCDRLRELRRSRGMTLRVLGEKISVAESTVSLYETGKREPDFETLRKLAEYFGVTTDYLLGAEAEVIEKRGEEAVVMDEEAMEIMDEMHKRPELRTLFSTTLKARKADIEAVDKLLRHMAEGRDEE